MGAELLIAEYGESFGLATVIDRCGVIAGPWQMGKADLGVFTHWLSSFYFRRPLTYLGFGATGKQLRDVLHVLDLVDLVEDQLQRPDHWAGGVVNVGGGSDGSLSLLETTEICRELTGHDVEVTGDPDTRPGDVRIYVSDCRALKRLTDWTPGRPPRQILADIYTWIHDEEGRVTGALAGG